MVRASAQLQKFQLTAARRRLGCQRVELAKHRLFQLTAARRRLVPSKNSSPNNTPFQLTAARRRLDASSGNPFISESFNSQPPEGGWSQTGKTRVSKTVSTHSRPKAAGYLIQDVHIASDRFNSQPPEGGWPLPQQLNDKIN